MSSGQDCRGPSSEIAPNRPPMRQSSSARKASSSRAMTRAASSLLRAPRDAGAIVLERQDRERSAGKEMLDRDSAMRLAEFHRRDDAGLPVGPADGLDAGGVPQFRILAVGRDAKRRADRHRRSRSRTSAAARQAPSFGFGRRDPGDRRVVRDRMVKRRAERRGGNHIGCRTPIRRHGIVGQPRRPDAVAQG